MEMFVSIRYLRTFLAIAESGSFAAASRSVRRTQSAVTVQMKALEDELGLVLFDRARRPPVLSPGGRAFLPRAIEAFDTDRRPCPKGANSFAGGVIPAGVVASQRPGVRPNPRASPRGTDTHAPGGPSARPPPS